MALNKYNLKKWFKMLSGKSVLHVNQNIGTLFSTSDLQGYYNNLTEKVTRVPQILHTEELPQMELPNGKYIYFSVGVFQYGLGAYDLYLENNSQIYYKKFWQTVEWTINHQEECGAWDTFGWLDSNAPYGAMAQGEAISLLTRAYKETLDYKYLLAATNAVQFLLKSVEDGGCTQYKNNDVFLLEYTNKPIVLNGWIFALWGLYDYILLTNDAQVREKYQMSLYTLANNLQSFCSSYWSFYDNSKKIASPFYHNLHIAQMQAMFQITGMPVFKEYELLWRKKQRNLFCKIFAFICKGWQKVIE